MYSIRKKFQWVWLLFFVLIPLLFSTTTIENLHIKNLIQKGEICDVLTFYYDDDRHIKTHNIDYSYVFLPTFANLSEIGVETTMDTVVFDSTEHTVTINEGSRKICQFQPDVIYTVSFYNNYGKLLATDEIIFLKSNQLPTLYITTETGTMDKLNDDKTYSEAGTYELVSTSGTSLFSDKLTSISSRGNQTFLYDKKSYQIDLAQPESILGMNKSDTWILLSNVLDSSYIRNKLTYDMAVQAGMEGSPHSEYIDVFFNGAYAGMYLLTEKVELAENRLDFDDIENSNTLVNNKKLKQYPTYVLEDQKQKAFKLPNNPTDITGGYLIEHDYSDKYTDAQSGFTTKNGEKFVLKNPTHASVEEIEYISSYMQEIEDAIMASNGVNPNTGKHYTEYIDINSWADKYIIEEISRNNGGGATSSYFYKPSDSISNKVFGGPVWDYDKAYGNFHSYNKNTRDLEYLTLHICYTNWFYYLYQHDDFVYTVKRNYQQKFSDYLAVVSSEKIDDYTSIISDAARLDNARYSYIYSSLDYVENPLDHTSLAESIKEFVSERKIFLDQVWIENYKIHNLHFNYDNENGNRTVGIIEGENLQCFPSIHNDETIAHWIDADTGDIFTLDTPITKETTIVPVRKQESE